MLIVWGIIGAVLIFLVVLTGSYLYNNSHFERALIQKAIRAGFESKKVTLADGSVISYGEGPGNGPALLLIHGQTVAWEDYARVLPKLSKAFHVYAVDCYGHGESSHGANLYSCQANGEALIWFINNVIKENCYLSGHSSGGILAAWIAANAPARINGLVLEDPPLFRVTPEEIQKDNGAFAWYDAYLVTHAFAGQTVETDFSLYYLKHGYLLTLFGGLKDKIVESAVRYRQKNPGEPIKISWVPHTWLRTLLYMDHYDPRFGNAFYDGSWMKDANQENILKSLTCPVIYLKANTQYGKDGVLYAANTDGDGDKVQALIENCERINIKCGHDIHFERPEVFLSACEKLLN